MSCKLEALQKDFRLCLNLTKIIKIQKKKIEFTMKNFPPIIEFLKKYNQFWITDRLVSLEV